MEWNVSTTSPFDLNIHVYPMQHQINANYNF
jgi:hypothetical protein